MTTCPACPYDLARVDQTPAVDECDCYCHDTPRIIDALLPHTGPKPEPTGPRL